MADAFADYKGFLGLKQFTETLCQKKRPRKTKNNLSLRLKNEMDVKGQSLLEEKETKH